MSGNRPTNDSAQTLLGTESFWKPAKAHEAYQCGLPPLPQIRKQDHARTWRESSIRLIRRLAPPLLTTFLAAIFVVLEPINSLSGSDDWSSLTLVFCTLTFHHQGRTIGKIFHHTSIGLVGGLIGLGLSAVAIELSSLAVDRGYLIGGRAIPACVLALMIFVGGVIKSRYPAMATGCLMSGFIAIWLIGYSTVETEMPRVSVLGMLFPTVFAAGISFFCAAIIFPRTAHAALSRQMETVTDTISTLLLASLHLFQASAHETTPMQIRQMRDQILCSRARLDREIAVLKTAYEEARFEITYAFIPIRAYEPFVKHCVDLQGLLTCRTGLDVSPFDIIAVNGEEKTNIRSSHVDASVRTLVDQLGQANLAAIAYTRTAIAKASKSHSSSPDQRTKAALGSSINTTALGGLAAQSHFTRQRLQRVLTDAVDKLKDGIVSSLEEAISEDSAAQSALEEHLFRENTIKDCYFLTSLVELSDTSAELLSLAEQLPDPAKGARRRIRLHRPNKAFFKARHGAGTYADSDDSDDDEGEYEQKGRREHVRLDGQKRFNRTDIMPIQHVERSWSSLTTLHTRIHDSYKAWCNSPDVLRRRIQLSKAIHRVFRSPHLKYGIKAALGVSLLTLPGHLPSESPGYKWYKSCKGQWISICFLYVLGTTTAATNRIAFYRSAGTLLGAFYGLVGQIIVGTNPYGLVAVMVVSSLVTDYMILEKPRVAYLGIVWQMTVPSILFVPALQIPYSSILDVALTRAYDIEIGILAALVITNCLWPYHARKEIVSTCAKAVDRIARLFLSMSKQNLHANGQPGPMGIEVARQFEHLEHNISTMVGRGNSLCGMLRLEMSLSPKPIAEYRRLLESMTELASLFAGLRSIRRHIPRKSTILDVLPERTEVVSSILLCLHACSHSLHTGSPVPQFLPQPRLALSKLVSAIEAHVERSFAVTRASTTVLARRVSTDPDPPVAESMPQVLLSLPDGESKVPDFSPAFHLQRQTTQTSIPYSRQSGKLGFSFAFALAEHEALSEAVEALENLLDTCRDLYSEATFIQPEDLPVIDLHSHLATPTPGTRSRRGSDAASFYSGISRMRSRS